MTPFSPQEWAVVRLTTFQEQRKQPARVLFATVTLLSHGRPLPSPMNDVEQCSIRETGQSIFFRRTILSKQDAIDWYRSLGNGQEKAPMPTRQEDRIGKDGVNIFVSSLTDNPIWPHIGLPMGKGLFAQPMGGDHPAPFMGNIPARVHRRFGNHEGFNALLADDHAVAFVARRMHINLQQYPEYLGSVALIAPDPIIQQIDNFMIPADEKHGERIFYRFIPRPGQTLEDLRITTFDEQAHLLTSFETNAIPTDGVLVVDKGSCTGQYGFVVTHPVYGILAYSPPTGFLRQINFRMHATGGGTKISVPISDAKNSTRMEYLAADRPQIASNSTIGDSPDASNVNARVANAASQREKLANAVRHGQRWFANGSREDAMRFIQSEIGRAQFRVMVADPYLAGLQLGQFLYAISEGTAELTLLTSGLAFNSRNETKTKLDMLEGFTGQLTQLEAHLKATVNVYVISAAVLHDRFLVIDNDVWFLGNSLNALGDKASMIVKVPNPDEIIEHLNIMRQQADSLDSYIADVTKALGAAK